MRCFGLEARATCTVLLCIGVFLAPACKGKLKVGSQQDGGGGTCDTAGRTCCDNDQECGNGALCSGPDQFDRRYCCSLPGGASCEGTNECCGVATCNSGACCIAEGTQCRSSNECCEGATCQSIGGAVKQCTAVGTDCGDEEQDCCVEDQCQAGLECRDNKCALCGGYNEPCCVGHLACPDTHEGNSLYCVNKKCRPLAETATPNCGISGKNCCSGSLCYEGYCDTVANRCRPPREACEQLDCGGCIGASHHCGWCENIQGDSKCLASKTDGSGPLDETKCTDATGDRWVQPATFGGSCDGFDDPCEDTATVGGGDTCATCASARGYCGWCSTLKECRAGDFAAATTGQCTDWVYLPGNCGN